MPPIDFVISQNPNLSRVAGKIIATDSAWIVQNLGRFLTVRVIHPDGGAFHDLEPADAQRPSLRSRRSVALTWPAGIVEVRPTGRDVIQLHVTAEVDHSEPVPAFAPNSTKPPGDIEKDRYYFVTLLVLCENRLLDATDVVAPTDQQIRDRLRATRLDPAATTKMVERRLAAARDHLGLGPDKLKPGDFPRGSIRALLMDTAIATGAVTRGDLVDTGLLK